MKKAILFISLALFIEYLNAQEVKSKQPCFKVTSFSSTIGFAGAMTSNTESDYYGLKGAVENPDLFVDVTGFSSNNNYYDHGSSHDYSYDGNGGSGNGSFVFNLGLTPYSKKLGKYRDNRELRFSVGSNFGSRNTFNYYDNISFVIDTLQSISGGGGNVYADSNINNYYTYTLNFSSINFGLSYLFKTDVKRRVHFYAGVGVNYDIALKSTVDVDHDTYKSVIYYNENQNPPGDDDTYYYNGYNNGSYSYNSSSTNLTKPMQFVRFYIPTGLKFRLSNKPTSFFNNVDLYTEMNPGVELQIIGDDKTYANPYFGVAFIGFNYHW
jgi:hypothetical protein